MCLPVVHDLDGPDLADEGPHDAVGFVILELTDVNLKRSHIHKGDAHVTVELLEDEDPLWLVSLSV